MDSLEKMQLVRNALAEIQGIASLETGSFRNRPVLSFNYIIGKDAYVQALFIPELNAVISFLPTDENLLTIGQWIYLTKRLDDMMYQGFKRGLLHTEYEVHFREMSQFIEVIFPTERAKAGFPFDLQAIIKAIKNFRDECMMGYYTLLQETLKILKGRHPYPISGTETGILQRQINSKEDLLSNVKQLFYCNLDEDLDGSVYAIMSINELSQLFNAAMEDYPEEKKKTLLAIKEYYSPSTWFSLSKEGMTKFFQDLRESFMDDF